MTHRLFSTEQVAELLGAAPGDVSGWIARGWLPVKRLPDGQVRVSERSVVAFLKDRGIDIKALMAKAILKEGGGEARGEATRPADRPRSRSQSRAADVQPIAEPRRTAESAARTSGRSNTPQPAGTAADEAKTDSDPGVYTDPRSKGSGRVLPSACDASRNADAPTRDVRSEASGDRDRSRGERRRVDLSPPAAGQLAEALLQDAAVRGASEVWIEPEVGGESVCLRVDERTGRHEGLNRCLTAQGGRELVSALRRLAEQAFGGTPGRFRLDSVGPDVVFQVDREAPSGLRLAVEYARRPADAEEMILVPGTEERIARVVEAGGIVIVSAPSQRERDLLCRALADACDRAGRRFVRLQEPDATLNDDRAASVLARAADEPDALLAFPTSDAGEAVRRFGSRAATDRRLVDGIRALLVARTLRRLCPDCRRRVEITADAAAAAGLATHDVGPVAWAPGGCKACGWTGYRGRGMVLATAGDELLAPLLRRGQVHFAARLTERTRRRELLEGALAGVRCGQTGLAELRRALADIAVTVT